MIVSKKRDNRDVEVLSGLLLWNYGRLDLRLMCGRHFLSA